MSIQRLPIKDFLFNSRGNILLDVRSPAEFNQAHMPGAISFPLFTDEERKIVGTTYKQQSREKAIKAGLDFFGPKMSKMICEVEEIIKNQNVENKLSELLVQNEKPKLFVYCWRGGMRSAGVAWLLDLYGFKVFTLAGGYKAFRNDVLQTFREPFDFKILGGYTGSGKTAVLNQLKRNGEPIIDLELLACHRGSAFGGFNMPKPPRQEMFENLLAAELRCFIKKKDPGNLFYGTGRYIWLEDESQRIGDINIPPDLWQKMRNAPIVFMDIPFEERLDYITQEYGVCDREKLKEAVVRIKKRLGGLDAKNTLEHLELGNIKEAFRILLHYYDKQYLKGLHNRENLSALLTKINCEKVSNDNAQLLITNIQTA